MKIKLGVIFPCFLHYDLSFTRIYKDLKTKYLNVLTVMSPLGSVLSDPSAGRWRSFGELSAVEVAAVRTDRAFCARLLGHGIITCWARNQAHLLTR